MSTRPLGLKIHSTSLTWALAAELSALLERQAFDFTEIYLAPGDGERAACLLRSLRAYPWVVHVAHQGDACNPSVAGQAARVAAAFAEAQRLADVLGAWALVLHGGYGGSLAEACRQLGRLRDERLLLENLPARPIACEGSSYQGAPQRFVGTTAAQMRTLAAAAGGAGLCLDISHCACAAVSLEIPVEQMLLELGLMGPALLHLCDGAPDSAFDLHLPPGLGCYPLRRWLSALPAVPVVLEVNCLRYDTLAPRLASVEASRKLLSGLPG